MATTGPPAMNNVTNDTTSNVVCYAPAMVTAGGAWHGVNPLDYSLPLLIVQMILVVLTTRAVVFVLTPLRQPRVIGEIISGIVLGPSVFGRINWFAKVVFPPKSFLVLETVGYLGLVFYMFLVGVEMDLNIFRRMQRKAMVIAAAGMLLPFTIGTSTSFIFRHHFSKNVHPGAFSLFLGIALFVTAFPVLARILADTKLLNSELGRIAMSSAIVNDLCAWFLLALSVALAKNQETALPSLWLLLCGTGFTLLCFYTVRPAMWWVLRRIPEGEVATDFQVCCIMTGVMVAAFVTDAIGIHSVFGAFVFGLVIPNGPLGVAIIEKLEDFVTGGLLPLFLVLSGLKTNVSTIRNPASALLILVIFLASASKVIGATLVGMFYNMPLHEGISLGFLLNTKGLVELIVLNVGRDKMVLNDESFALFVLASLAMTALVTPVVNIANRSSRRLIGYKRRNLQRWSNPESELRMLAVVHNSRHVPSIVSLLEVSNPTKRSPIFVYALHLVELAGRSSAMLVVHNASAKPGRGQAQSEHIFAAFESYEQHAGGVSVQTLTAISPYATMHEDVCHLAEDKHAALIILPFHMQQTVDGGMGVTNPALRAVNESVLAGAPCSVGVLVDRGLSGTTRIVSPADQQLSHHVAVLFFGGPDDREALAYAWRMAEHPGISLSVFRFLPGEQFAAEAQMAAGIPPPPPPAGGPRDSRMITIVTNGASKERQQDDEYLNEFRVRKVADESVTYAEEVVNNSEETVAAIRSMDCIYDLYIVGRRQGEAAPLTAGLTEFTECPELGPIGDLLATSDFAATVSVLVMQQYVAPAVESPGRTAEQYVSNPDQRARAMARAQMGTARGPYTSWNSYY